MKKTIALLLTIIFTVALLPMAAGAAAFSNGAMTLTMEGGTPVEGTHFTYELENPATPTDGYRLTLLTSGGSYTLGGEASDRLRVVASATDITLTLDNATFTGPDDAVDIGSLLNATAAIEFPHGGVLVARGTSAVTGGNKPSEAVLALGDLAVEVPDGTSLTLTGGQGTTGAESALNVRLADLQLTVGGTLRCETGENATTGHEAGIASYYNLRLAYTSATARVEAVGHNGGRGISAATLTVTGAAGTLTARGYIGIYITGGTLDLGAAHVTAEGEGTNGILFGGYLFPAATLRGDGTLTAQGGVDSYGIAYPGIRAQGDLTLAYTGDLAATGGSGRWRRTDQGGGVFHIYAGDGLGVYGDLTVAAAPRSLALTRGVWNGMSYDEQNNSGATATPDGFYAVRVLGSWSWQPAGDAAFTAATVNRPLDIRWPVSDGEWVTVWPKENPPTGS